MQQCAHGDRARPEPVRKGGGPRRRGGPQHPAAHPRRPQRQLEPARRLHRRAHGRRQRARPDDRRAEEHRLRLRAGRRRHARGVRPAPGPALRRLLRLDLRRAGRRGVLRLGPDRRRRAAARARVPPRRRRGADGGGHRGRRRRARAGRADRPRRPQDHRLGVLGLPARPLHDAGRDATTASWPPRSPPAGATPAPTWTSTRSSPASGRRCWRRSPTTHSLALQQSLFAMGEAVLERHPDVAEIRMSMPNKHHFLQDLSAYGLDNPGRRLPRRRPPVRADRGDRAARRRRPRPTSPGRAPPASAEPQPPEPSTPMPPSSTLP